MCSVLFSRAFVLGVNLCLLSIRNSSLFLYAILLCWHLFMYSINCRGLPCFYMQFAEEMIHEFRAFFLYDIGWLCICLTFDLSLHHNLIVICTEIFANSLYLTELFSLYTTLVGICLTPIYPFSSLLHSFIRSRGSLSACFVDYLFVCRISIYTPFSDSFTLFSLYDISWFVFGQRSILSLLQRLIRWLRSILCILHSLIVICLASLSLCAIIVWSL